MRILFALLLVSSVAFGQVNTTKKITFKEGETPKIGIVISGLSSITRVEVTFRNSLNAVVRKFSTVDATITLSDTTYTFSFTDLQTIGKAGRGTWQVEIRSEAGVKKTDVYTYEIYKATTLTGSTTPATAGGYNYLFEWDFTPITPTFDVIASGIIVVDDVSISSALNGKVDKVTGKGLSQNDYTNSDKVIVDGVTANLALKAPIANPTFTGTVSGITKTMVGLSNVDNTSDANKPVSTATQTALNTKPTLYNFDTYALALAGMSGVTGRHIVYVVADEFGNGGLEGWYMWNGTTLKEILVL